MAPLTSRRNFLAVSALASVSAPAFTQASCARKRATRYHAWLYVASASEKAVVIADLASFQRSGSVPLGASPDLVMQAGRHILAVCGADQSVVRIDPEHQNIIGKVSIGGKIVSAVVSADGDFLAVVTSQPPAMVVVEIQAFRVVRRTALTGTPSGIAATDGQVAVLLSTGSKDVSVARIGIADGKWVGTTPIGTGAVSALNYRKDGKTIFAAASDARQIVTFDAQSGALLTRLPVPIRPARFCVDGTGGQVFVTGADQEDQMVIFSPYQNQIDQTLYGGRSPYGMAVAPARNLLFLTNPRAGTVTIIDIDTRTVAGSVRTGGTPREVLIAAAGGQPEEYAFVVDSDSGDVSVLHIPLVLRRGSDALIAQPAKPVFTVFHGGGAPQSAVIVPYSS